VLIRLIILLVLKTLRYVNDISELSIDRVIVGISGVSVDRSSERTRQEYFHLQSNVLIRPMLILFRSYNLLQMDPEDAAAYRVSRNSPPARVLSLKK